MFTSPSNQPIKVFGVGLGRTGTLSLCIALEKLGFGPCYHPLHVPRDQGRWVEWAKVMEGQTDPEFIDSILKGFNSAVDSPVALVADTLYKTYPDAKFILTTRDLDKWIESNMAVFFNPQLQSLLPVFERIQKGTLTDEDHNLLASMPDGQGPWLIAARSRPSMKGKHPLEGLREEFLNHTAWIKEVIPSDKLLIFNVKEGWEPLVKFLGVSEPEEPFPKVNEAANMADRIREFLDPILQLQ
ncbi:hypothetical protein Clacol_005184 [Clathrus columnatus]|uniref:P-loop containing nucleoside triphosphate hydrolase protein n=1 Tax=Clathrus columnatus TaxID=1419009 RepID=A0AAV5ADG5_9AGAM|nr:hypothetical protein Clacol_005184 [Clathrus columnatus]